MRNLKKILALVLALVMVVGMMTVATAAKPGTGYVDDAAIVNYDEAIQVLSALGVYRGDEKGNFNPNDTITRGEFAAIVYRIVHDDVNDTYTKIYSDYNKFDDVKSSDWNAGYINYCANGEYILGDGAGNFIPNGKVNGYQVLAVMLRALGYDKEGEFQGAGWEVRTARKAKELGITTTVTEGTLGAPATRALVAELVFRSIVKASTVNYIKLVGYVKTGATLAYLTFGLQGTTEVLEGNTNQTINSVLDYADYCLYSPEDYEAMSERALNCPDLEIQDSTLKALYGQYGEPIAFWYVPGDDEGEFVEIPVRFNPIMSTPHGLYQNVLYTLLQPVYDRTGANKAVPVHAVYVDGESAGSTSAYKDYPVLVYGQDWAAGTGAQSDVFVYENGAVSLVVKNTYADFVTVAFNAKNYAPMTLALDGTIDYDCGVNFWADGTSYEYGFRAVNAGIARGSLVTYNKYADYIAHTTIKVASAKTVTLTNSYVDNVYTSYFKAGKDTYTYDCNYLGTVLRPELLDREALVATGDETQLVFFDEWGYVIFAMDVPEYATTGYMLVTNATYGGYSNDNGYYMNIKGYGLDGKAMTVKGGFDQFVYGTKTDAQDNVEQIGIYKYVIDSESGLYMLTDDDQIVDSSRSTMIPAGCPDAVSFDPSGDLADDNTVFVVANYNKNGLITGYTVTKGIKNIKDLTDAEITPITGVKDNYQWNVSYVDDDTVYADGLIDLVFVTGAKQTADTRHKVDTQKDVFFLLNDVPEKKFTEYDLYAVIMNGKLDYLKVYPLAGIEANLEAGYFYTITGETEDYASDFEVISDAEITYAGAGVLAFDYYTVDDIWEHASCDDGFVVLADNCKIVDLTLAAYGQITPVTAEDLIIDSILKVNALGYDGVYGYVAEYNQYGHATLIYVVGF